MIPRVRYWQVVKAVVFFQVLSGLLYSGQSYWLMYRGIPWWTLALYYSAVNLFWAAASPIVLWLAYRFAIERSRWIPHLAIHVLAASALSFAALAHQAIIDRVFRGEVVDFLHFSLWGGYQWPDFNLADTWIVIGVAFLIIELLAAEGEARSDPAGAERGA